MLKKPHGTELGTKTPTGGPSRELCVRAARALEEREADVSCGWKDLPGQDIDRHAEVLELQSASETSQGFWKADC